jgi:hypothetical protein
MRNPTSRYAHHVIAVTVFASMFSSAVDAMAADAPHAVVSAQAAWHDGSARYDFVMDEQTLTVKPLTVATDDRTGSDGLVRCILVVPKRAASGNPWTWRDLYRNHQPPPETELLTRGFHLVHRSLGFHIWYSARPIPIRVLAAITRRSSRNGSFTSWKPR